MIVVELIVMIDGRAEWYLLANILLILFRKYVAGTADRFGPDAS